MSKSTSKIHVLALCGSVLALSGCGNTPIDDGSGFLKTKSGEMISWPTGSTVVFQTDSSVPQELRKQIALGEDDLNKELTRVKVSVQLQSSQAPKIKKSIYSVIGDGKNGIYFLPEPWPWMHEKGKENSDAMTVIKNDGSTIVEADIFYRVSSFSAKYSMAGQYYNNPATPNKQIAGTSTNQFVLNADANISVVDKDSEWTKVGFIHECMHALGFTHINNEKDSIMNPVVSITLYSSPFSPGDIQRLRTLYSE